MTGYVGLAVGLIGALLQATVLHEVRLGSVHPDLVVIAVTGWAAMRRFDEGLLWAVLGGLSLDLFSAGPFGMSVIATVAAAVVAAGVAAGLRGTHSALIIVAMPFGLTAYYAVSIGLLHLGGSPIDLTAAVTGVLLPALLLDSLFSPLVLILLAILASVSPTDSWSRNARSPF